MAQSWVPNEPPRKNLTIVGLDHQFGRMKKDQVACVLDDSSGMCVLPKVEYFDTLT
jgi:hypothetical protein